MAKFKLRVQHTISPVLTNKFLVGHDAWIKLNSQCLCMIGRTRTNSSIRGIRDNGVSSRVSYGGLQNTLVLRRRKVFQEYVFDAPEAAFSECSDLRLGCSLGKIRCMIKAKPMKTDPRTLWYETLHNPPWERSC